MRATAILFFLLWLVHVGSIKKAGCFLHWWSKAFSVMAVQRKKGRGKNNKLPLFLPVHTPPALLSRSSQSTAAGASHCSNLCRTAQSFRVVKWTLVFIYCMDGFTTVTVYHYLLFSSQTAHFYTDQSHAFLPRCCTNGSNPGKQHKLKLSPRRSANPMHSDLAVTSSLPCWDKTTLKKPCRTSAPAPSSVRTDHPKPQEQLLPVCVQHFKTIDIQQADDSFPSWILLKIPLLCNCCFSSHFFPACFMLFPSPKF